MSSIERRRTKNTTQLSSAGGSGVGNLTPEHYLLVLKHRKWLILGVFLLVSCGTAVVSYTLPDVYTSQTALAANSKRHSAPDHH
jgi:uncharacterized protein involved in exopolysaccharide biosynthesis